MAHKSMRLDPTSLQQGQGQRGARRRTRTDEEDEDDSMDTEADGIVDADMTQRVPQWGVERGQPAMA